MLCLLLPSNWISVLLTAAGNLKIICLCLWRNIKSESIAYTTWPPQDWNERENKEKPSQKDRKMNSLWLWLLPMTDLVNHTELENKQTRNKRAPNYRTWEFWKSWGKGGMYVWFLWCPSLIGFVSFWSIQCRLRKLKRPLLLEGGGAINIGTWFFCVIWICVFRNRCVSKFFFDWRRRLTNRASWLHPRLAVDLHREALAGSDDNVGTLGQTTSRRPQSRFHLSHVKAVLQTDDFDQPVTNVCHSPKRKKNLIQLQKEKDAKKQNLPTLQGQTEIDKVETAAGQFPFGFVVVFLAQT